MNASQRLWIEHAVAVMRCMIDHMCRQAHVKSLVVVRYLVRRPVQAQRKIAGTSASQYMLES